MPTQSDIHRLALLLNGLGDGMAEPALAGLGAKTAALVRTELATIAKNPPGQEVLNNVLDDFETFMRFALKTAGEPSNWAANLFDDEPSENDAPKTGTSKPALKLFQPTEDPVEDLKAMSPTQIAGALGDEHPKTVCLILSCLPNETAAMVIDLLPEEIQSKAFLALRKQQDVPPDLLHRIARKTVEKAALVEPKPVETKDDVQKTADLLRAMPKATRNRLMADLEKSDPDSVAQLRELLYVFSDIVRYDNRSIQKLLGQFDTNVLVLALQGIETEVSDRIFENLSKRAASAVKEEMEFKQSATTEEIEEARTEISRLIAELDGRGDLKELQ